MKRCPICGAEMKEVEILTGKLNTPNVVNDSTLKVNRADLTVYRCPVCEHGAIDNFLDEEFYYDFSVALGGEADDDAAVNQRSKQFEPMIDFMAEYSPNTDRLLEIGSGCGYLLNASKRKFMNALGVEPSKAEYDISTKVAPECDIINDFFNSGLEIKDKFSAFIATMVFEHIPDVVDAINYAHDLLVEDGVGFITVPNGQRAFLGGCYYDIYPQHLHYFSILSLSKLALTAGFEIIFVRESETRDYLEMMVRKRTLQFSSKFNKRLAFDKSRFQEMLLSYKNVSIWGASYVARSCMEFFDPKIIKHFYDVSSVKIGKYISEFPKVIEKPDKNSVNENDLIIIMANEYTKDILKSLGVFGYKGKVIGFDSDGYITELAI